MWASSDLLVIESNFYRLSFFLNKDVYSKDGANPFIALKPYSYSIYFAYFLNL